MPLRPLARLFFAIAFVAFFGVRPLNAQITDVNNSTSTPTPGAGHNYLGTLNETVDPANGSLSLRLGISVPPGRKMQVPFSFAYDSNGVHFPATTSSGSFTGVNWTSNFNSLMAQGGWAYSVPQLGWSGWKKQHNWQGTNYDCWFATNFLLQDLTGGRHSLGIGWNSHRFGCSNSGSTGSLAAQYLNGGDDQYRASLSTPGISATFQGAVSADGTLYSFSAGSCASHCTALVNSIEDRNGNRVLFTSSGAGVFSVTDELGRTLLSSSGFGTTGNTVAVSGISNPYSVIWGSATSNFSVSETYPPVAPGNCPIPSTVSGTQSVITAITLPNGQQYQFSYDPTYGELSKITYPAGGYVSYSWGLNAQSAVFEEGTGDGVTCASHKARYDKPAILHRYVSFDGSAIALQQDFAYSTTWDPNNWDAWTSKQTTVTTQDLVRGTSFQTIYNYVPYLTPAQPYSVSALDNRIALESTITYKSTSGTTLKTVTKGWFDQSELACQLETLDNGQISGVFYAYGPGGQVTDKKEYDYGIVTSTSACPGIWTGSTTPPTATPTRETVYNYQNFPNTPIFTSAASIFDRPSSVVTYGNGVRAAETDFSYDQVAVSAVSPAPAGHDETNYPAGSAAPRGNATTIVKQCFQGATACTNATSTFTFDETGQILTKTDACGNATCSDMTGSNHTTSFSYVDNFDSLPSSNTNAYVTQISDSLGHTSTMKYAYSDGKLLASTDQNGLITSYLYGDSLRRLTETDLPDGGQTTLSYNDTAPSPTVTTSKKINTTQSVTTVTKTDGMGHVVQTQLTTDPQGTVLTDTTFDGIGQVWKQSNPYRAGTDPTTSSGTTTFVYDALGRKISTTYPDGSVQSTAYCGPNTLATDPTGKWRRSRTDGLGFLVEVDEPNAPGASVVSTGCPGTGEPIWVTSYGYDGLGNLVSVLQNASRSRSFTYDSLSRLLTSTNPEVGTITYTYDANSNVSTKKDARNITATYGYDVLNRLKTTTYSNSDPSIAINYDESNCLGLATCQNIGQRTSMTDAAGSEAWSYQVDSANHRSVHVNQRTNTSTPSNVTRTSTYYLDLAGNITQMVYPSGRIVNYAYDNANRPKSASDGTSGVTYATAPVTPLAGCPSAAVCYTPQGSVYSMSIGQTSSFTGLNTNETFNNRLQPNEIKASSTGGNAFDLSYNYIDPVSGKNAGHVYGTINNLDTTRSQTFTYDQLNRITSAQTSSTFATAPTKCWGENYQYDGLANGAWGNLTQIAATTNSAYTGCSQESGFTKTVDANNHISGLTYDAAGNTSNDGTYTYNWNAESQLTSTSANIFYRYDGDGRRAAKTDYHGNPTKLYWYGSGGEILSETNPAAYLIYDYIFFGGKRVAQVSNAPNLNGGFESGSQNWSASGSGTASIVNNAANAHSGSSYAELSVPAGSGISTTFTSTVPISAQIGETITATGWVYREQNGQQYSRWWMTVTGSNGAQGGHAADNTTMNAWIQQSISVTVPSWLQGPYTVTVWAEVDATSTTQATSARFDDATLNGNTLLFAEDSLGTTRVTTDPSGVVCYDADFYPFGGERTPYVNTCTQNTYKFEGKERDTETGNDDFGARYYSNRFGRWLSADWSNAPVPIPYANLRNPQSLNLYAMVGNDPESFADLDGHCCLDCPPSEKASCLGHAPENIRETELGKLADDQLAEQAAAEQQNKQQAQSQNPINMTVTVLKEPGVQVNAPIGGEYATGVATELQLTFTDSNGKPLKGTATERNVEAGSGNVVENPNPVNLSKKGTTTDWIGFFFRSAEKAHLTPDRVADLTGPMISQPHTTVSTQTITIRTAKDTYQVDWKRTFSNVGADGKVGNYTITWTTPVIKRIPQ